MDATGWNHPHYGHYLKWHRSFWHRRVHSPCCNRKVQVTRIFDLRMVPMERRPNIYSQSDWACEHCINHAILNLRTLTYRQLALDMGAPQRFIDSAHLLDVGIEANRNR